MDHNLMVFIGSLMNVFVLDRQVRVFFDKRRTRFLVFALPFLFYVVFINVTAQIPRGSMHVYALMSHATTTKRRRILSPRRLPPRPQARP